MISFKSEKIYANDNVFFLLHSLGVWIEKQIMF